MQTWKVLMEDGHRCVSEKSWLDAELCYHNAVEQIKLQWENKPEDEALLMAWISTQHHLASIYEAQDQHYTALRYLTMPHQWMMSLLRGEAVADTFKALTTQAIKVTLMPLLDVILSVNPVLMHYKYRLNGLTIRILECINVMMLIYI